MAQSGIMALASRRRLESGHEMGRVVKSLRALCMHRTPLVTFVINLVVIRIRPDAFACVLSHGWGSCKEVLPRTQFHGFQHTRITTIHFMIFLSSQKETLSPLSSPHPCAFTNPSPLPQVPKSTHYSSFCPRTSCHSDSTQMEPPVGVLCDEGTFLLLLQTYQYCATRFPVRRQEHFRVYLKLWSFYKMLLQKLPEL